MASPGLLPTPFHFWTRCFNNIAPSTIFALLFWYDFDNNIPYSTLFIFPQIAKADSHRGSYFSMTGCLYSVLVLPLNCAAAVPLLPWLPTYLPMWSPCCFAAAAPLLPCLPLVSYCLLQLHTITCLVACVIGVLFVAVSLHVYPLVCVFVCCCCLVSPLVLFDRCFVLLLPWLLTCFPASLVLFGYSMLNGFLFQALFVFTGVFLTV